jgi:hypothetical protein
VLLLTTKVFATNSWLGCNTRHDIRLHMHAQPASQLVVHRDGVVLLQGSALVGQIVIAGCFVMFPYVA